MTEDDSEVHNTSFLPTAKVQTPRPTSRSVTLRLSSIVDAGNANEARYWSKKFGLGPSAATRSVVDGRNVQLNAGSAAVVHDIVIGQTAFATDSKARHTLLAVACGPRVPLYGTTPQSAFQRALSGKSLSAEVSADRHVPTSGLLSTAIDLRADGRLLAIGTHAGTIRVADTTTRATLCQFRNGKSVLPIRSVQWFRDGQRIMAAGDDGTLRVFHLKQHNDGNAILEYRGHGDAIRAAQIWQSQETNVMVATGSYDHTVRLWDFGRKETNDADDSAGTLDPCLAVLEHGAPVEAVVWIRSTNPDVPAWLVSAGGTHLKVWNPRSGSCVSTLQAQHRKTITSLLIMRRRHGEGEDTLPRLLTAGLDGLVRIHEWNMLTGDLLFLHGLKLNDGMPITALACTFKGDRFAVGTADGKVLVRDMDYQPPPTASRKREPPAGTHRFFQRGQNTDAGEDDVVALDHAKKPKIKDYDKSIRQFRYSDALDEALATRNPREVLAVLEELSKRNGLLNALSNRDEETLEPVLAFTVKYITRPEFSSLLIGLAGIILDVYSDVSGQSETIDELFLKMKRRVVEEMAHLKLLSRLSGQIDAVITSGQLR